MRLFQALCRRKNSVPGNVWIGKHRLSRSVTMQDVAKLRNQFEIEEKNMFYLRHSYLTPEQSYGHAIALGKPQEKYVALITRKKDYKDNITIESMLGHLRHKEAWD
ncbi:large ribosomal subunit protein mL63 [Tribolium castaneum]|uniref:Ribosomal protein 63, mitochondrial-like Protein n=1 Tax=Tribolium castaneum TaxID=7070 RepID=D6WYS1_TRICA|nr:PREDICTED: ribosomal protein 63, mitochondrial [Tribolium castaneum]EFA08456.1 Ribosomal protein 63, mitochondrial-like Protein [Tribolium castaneum]|eukprot:XP_968840.1 PREDICTED: ribosomal protein 63, mitochondrial [Tribolium castaneum]